MYAHSIDRILSKNSITRAYFRGCYPADKIPPKEYHRDIYPYCIVVNMDCSGWKGSHWVSLFIESPSYVEYYDPLGDWPPISPYIINFLYSNFATIKYNTEQIQSANSTNCGKHAIYFLYKRCSGSFKSLNSMINYLLNTIKPDIIVNNFVRKIIENI